MAGIWMVRVTHLSAKPPPNRSHLKADDTTADDDHLLRDRRELERASRGHDRLLVHRHAVELRRLGAGGDDNVLAGQVHRSATLYRVELDRAGALDLAGALEVRDAILLEQPLDAARQPRHRLRLVLHQLVEVHLDVVGRDAVWAPAAGSLLVEMRRVEEGLRWDAPHVQARPAERPALLDASHLQAHLARLNRRRVAAGAATDDNDVKRPIRGGGHHAQARRHEGAQL